MNQRNLTIIGLLAVVAIVIGSVGFATADNSNEVKERTCDGTGVLGHIKGRGFWAQLTDEQRTMVAERAQEMIEAGATHEEIREMKATMLKEWGIDHPLWSGPRLDERNCCLGRQSRNRSRSFQHFFRHGNSRKSYNSNNPKVN